MEGLLRNEYHTFFGLTRRNVNVPSNTKIGSFLLFDKKACASCLSPCASEGIICINSDIPIKEIIIEDYFQQFQNTKADVKGRRCDELLYDDDNRRIAFLEMSCKSVGTSEDVQLLEGKREVAYEQLDNSIKKLQEVTVIAEKINKFAEKSALFAYRVMERASSIPSQLKNSLDAFMTPMELAENPNLSTEMDNGFKFRSIKFSEVYQW